MRLFVAIAMPEETRAALARFENGLPGARWIAPETFHVTLAAPPALSVAVNCSTDEPEALVALQPVQFVSMLPVPGAMVKVPFEGLAVTLAPPHPARIESAGTSTSESTRAALPKRR